MYKIFFNQLENTYEAEELIKMFLPPSEYQVIKEFGPEERSDPKERFDRELEGGSKEGSDLKPDSDSEGIYFIELPDGMKEKNIAKRFLYDRLCALTGKAPDWGTLTGVRPVKLAGEVFDRTGESVDQTFHTLIREYRMSEEKARLLLDLVRYQRSTLGKSDPRAIGLYIGIPFCPTRCVYCSFPSNQVSYDKIGLYLEALLQEIVFVGEEMNRLGWYPESVYVGGGTPTTLSAEDLTRLLSAVRNAFDLSKTREFTVEAGRPDTITEEKLQAILQAGAERISINPQSMKDQTLELIGRSHTAEEIRTAFSMAKQAGVPLINADLIAGLPREEGQDFQSSLDEIIGFQPANITVHTLAVKRASKLKEIADGYQYRQGEVVRDMLERARTTLALAGYDPYYLYRQKQMAGNFENVGYAKKNTASLYNIRIMEENQTIIALGAGGISKKFYPEENRLVRVPNVSNYEIYIQRLSEMLLRKKQGIFEREEPSC